MSAERYKLLFDASQQAVIVKMCMLEQHLPPAMRVSTCLRHLSCKVEPIHWVALVCSGLRFQPSLQL